jgi:hypothetical protein
LSVSRSAACVCCVCCAARGDLRRMLELHEAEQAAYRQGSDERERGVTSRSVSPQTPPVPARNTLGA